MGDNQEKKVIEPSIIGIFSHALSETMDSGDLPMKDPKTGHWHPADLSFAAKGKIIDYVYKKNYQDTSELAKNYLLHSERPKPIAELKSKEEMRQRMEENNRIKKMNRIALVSGLGEAHDRRRTIG